MSLYTKTNVSRGYTVRPVRGMRGGTVYQAMPIDRGIPGVVQGSPKYTVTQTQMAIASTEALRFVRPGSPGLATAVGDKSSLVSSPGAFRSDISGRGAGGGGGSSGSTSLVDQMVSARSGGGGRFLPGSGGASSAEGMMPIVTEEQMDQIRHSDPNLVHGEPVPGADVPVPGADVSKPWVKYVPAALGFVVGLGLLLLRR